MELLDLSNIVDLRGEEPQQVELKQNDDHNLKINSEYKKNKRAFIVDNFYEDPHSVRKYALEQEFFDDEGYVGKRTRTTHFFPGIKETFEDIIGDKITAWEEYGMNGRFQNNVAGERLVWHCDHQRWAAMIYLTPNAPPSCGTSTFMHKETRIHHNDQMTWGQDGTGYKVFPAKTWCDGTPYEKVDTFGNIFNRLVIFDGGAIHAANEYFGSDLEDSRLWHMFFFDTGPSRVDWPSG